MASQIIRVAQYIVSQLPDVAAGTLARIGINIDRPEATLHVGGALKVDEGLTVDSLAVTGAITAATVTATGAVTGGSFAGGGGATWIGYATSTLSGVLSAVAQSIAGLKLFVGGFSSAEYVGTNPEVGGSTPFTLTVAHKRIQMVNPAGAITINLPTTSVLQGERWKIVNRSSNLVTVKASGGDTVAILAEGHMEVMAITDAPTTEAGWRFLSLIDRGSWTPTIGTSGTQFTTVTYGVQRGWYNRNMGAVVLSAYVNWTNTTGVPTGGLRITSLPFACSNTPGADYGCAVHGSVIVLPGAATGFQSRISDGNSHLELAGFNSGNASAAVVASANGGATSRTVIAMASYAIAIGD